MPPCSFTAATACAPAIRLRRCTARSVHYEFTKARPTSRRSSSRARFLRGRGSDMANTVKLGPSAHVDTFTRDNLPPSDQWPEILLDRPEFQYPEYLNAGVELTDRLVERGFGDNT